MGPGRGTIYDSQHTHTMSPLKHLTRLVLPLIAAAAIAACSGMPAPATFPGGRQAATAERAADSARRGEHVQAAGMYETLARRAAAADRPGLLLNAAQEWLAAARPGDASRVLNGIGTLSAEQTVWQRILQADMAHANGQAQQAWQAISGIAAPVGTLGAYYYDARMRLALAAARPVESIRAEVAAEQAVADPAARSQLRTRLLTLLREARDRGVKLEPAASQDSVVRGWLDLGAISSATRGVSLTGGADAIRWRARYPGHPATELLAQALPAALTGSGTVTRIALLLPVTARNEAQIVRDGFRYALAQVPAATRPELAIYDTSTAMIGDVLAQARTDGSDFIVGPLTREEVTAAADFGAPLAPTLALNFLANERSAPTGFYQFALSPEDEARSVARRLLASGQKRGVALAPTGDWGNRVLASFTQELQAAGGVLLAQASYDPAAHDYGVPIKVALGTVESEARARRLQNLLGTRLEFEPRRRADIQFILAAGMSTNARLLRPQLRFNYAGTVPIYATSAAYTPEVGDSNQDLDGLQFPDMPWLLPDASIDELRNGAQQAGVSAAWRTRLFAFGYDACQLAIAIASAGRDPRRVQVAGTTGTLTLDDAGRVHRELVWARIRDGQPVLLGNPVLPN